MHIMFGGVSETDMLSTGGRISEALKLRHNLQMEELKLGHHLKIEL